MTREYSATFHGNAPRPVRWLLSYPARLYLRYAPFRRGKGLIENLVIRACIPASSQFNIRLPSGDQILMTGREKIGTYLLIYETFELAELRYCSTNVAPGSTAIDVGANVGIFSLTLSHIVADAGGVIAIEPSPANFARLISHIKINSRTNIRALQIAAGRENGIARLNVDVDPAFGAAIPEASAYSRGGPEICVDVRTLDDIWNEQNRPRIGFIKIDVEGAEAEVILGAEHLITTCQPILLVEAATEFQLRALRKTMAKFNYVGSNPAGFQPWNYVFCPHKQPIS
jgi:FkbM family methyltransferase